jgi:hypothetical protein
VYPGHQQKKESRFNLKNNSLLYFLFLVGGSFVRILSVVYPVKLLPFGQQSLNSLLLEENYYGSAKLKYPF